MERIDHYEDHLSNLISFISANYFPRQKSNSVPFHVHLNVCNFSSVLFTGPFDNSYATNFYSPNKNKAFGLNASPESAMSPSISSVATSASEVSEPKLCYLNVRNCCKSKHRFSFSANCPCFVLRVNSWHDSIHAIVHSTKEHMWNNSNLVDTSKRTSVKFYMQ